MNPREKGNAHIILIGVAVLFIIIPNIVFSQIHIKGKVVYQKDELPAAYATVELVKQEAGGLSDKGGNFSFYISKLKNDDTLLISSVGYETLKIPVLTALKRSEFVLVEKTKNLETVTVRSFDSSHVIGSSVESVGYYRSWNYKNTGGEIGRILKLPYKEYKIDKIRFKVSNFCDTCLLRLRIRNIVDGIPGDEILKDSVSMIIKELSLDGKVPEFDISAYDLIFTQPELFVGIQVINCRSGRPEPCSFSFAGTEKGQYMYKSRATSEWLTTDDYTIHLKLFLRY